MTHVGAYAQTVDSTIIADVLPRRAVFFPGSNTACRGGWT